MTTSSVTQTWGASSAAQMNRSSRGERPKEFQDLFEALKNGDTDKAKEALKNIKTKAPKGFQDSGNDPLAEVTKALESGDVAAAAEAFNSFESEMNGHRPPSMPQMKNGIENDLFASLQKSTLSFFA